MPSQNNLSEGCTYTRSQKVDRFFIFLKMVFFIISYLLKAKIDNNNLTKEENISYFANFIIPSIRLNRNAFQNYSTVSVK